MQTGVQTESQSFTLYSILLEGTDSPRKRKNLDSVWRALEHLRELGSPDYSVANVARAIKNLGLTGPKAQSIRNVEGKDFRTLIQSYASEFGPKQVKEVPLDEEIVASIDNHRLASLVQQALAENRSLKYRIDLLKKEFKKLQPFSSVPIIVSDEASKENGLALSAPLALPPASYGDMFDDRERDAVRTFLENLSSLEEVVPDADGMGALLYATNGLEFTPPSFLQALRKITLQGGENV